MQIKGLVAGVNDGSYKSRKGEQVDQWAVDIYDETAGIVPCAMSKNGVMPQQGRKVVADVMRIVKINFGQGYRVTIANVRELEGLPSFGPEGAAAGASVPVPPASAGARR